jgi:predicted PurR-regulated permease PerM
MNPATKPESQPGTDGPRAVSLAPPAYAGASEQPAVESASAAAARMAPLHFAAVVLGTVAFLYFARPVVLPIFVAWMAAMALRPPVRWLSDHRVPAALSAAVVFCLLVAAVTTGFIELERPAVRWMNEAPKHMTELRQRVRKMFPSVLHISQAANAVSDLGATVQEKKDDQKETPVIEVKDQRGTTSILNWTGTLLAGLGEVLVLIYLLLASGDLFVQKLVRVMPTLRGKIRALEISHEIQQNISNYLFSVSLINICLGAAVSVGLYFLGVPNAALWGLIAAALNFVPYFGPVAGVVLLAAVGLFTFNSPGQGLLPPLWYLLLHLLESNLVTPILLGRRFTLNPVAIFVSLIFWTWLWGIPGALLSIPILVSMKVISDRIPSMSHFGELIGR